MIESEQLCELIHTSLANLRWKFSELEGKQELVIDSYPPVYFSPTAKGTVAGGSAKWVRKKHNSGGIHEPGMIAIFDVLKNMFSILKLCLILVRFTDTFLCLAQQYLRLQIFIHSK